MFSGTSGLTDAVVGSDILETVDFILILVNHAH